MHQMNNNTGKNVNAKECKRRNEQVEISVVPLADAIPHPGTVVVKAVWKSFRKMIQNLFWKKQIIYYSYALLMKWKMVWMFNNWFLNKKIGMNSPKNIYFANILSPIIVVNLSIYV